MISADGAAEHTGHSDQPSTEPSDPLRLHLAGAAAEATQPRREAAHPDVLEVLAVDRVDDAVGANELDGAVDVDIYHCTTLTVLGGRKHPTRLP